MLTFPVFNNVDVNSDNGNILFFLETIVTGYFLVFFFWFCFFITRFPRQLIIYIKCEMFQNATRMEVRIQLML